MSKQVILTDLHPYEYEHPFDAKALDALQSTSGLDILVRQFNKQITERLITIQYTGSNLKITKNTHPKLYDLLDRVCNTINLPSRPDLYLKEAYEINGFTIGVDHPIIVLNSGSIDKLDDDELLYLIGHEVGHIKSRHTLYKQIAYYLRILMNVMGKVTFKISDMFLENVQDALQLALWKWSRMSELTADRAGLLACQDVQIAIRWMMKTAGMPEKFYDNMNAESFVKQAKEFDELDYNKLNQVGKFLSIFESEHPFTVMRTAELLRWIDSEEYNQVIQRKTIDRLNKKYEGNSVFCRKCGFRLEGSEKFCASCGQQL